MKIQIEIDTGDLQTAEILEFLTDYVAKNLAYLAVEDVKGWKRARDPQKVFNYSVHCQPTFKQAIAAEEADRKAAEKAAKRAAKDSKCP